ncbi:MAG: hypothetical protein WBO92_05250 [Candidatus Moraniibacteriota bacterium]
MKTKGVATSRLKHEEGTIFFVERVLGLTGFSPVAIILIDAFLSRFCLLVGTDRENENFL